jgi:hypothetical protein
MSIIYIDRRQYVCSTEAEQAVIRRTLSMREELRFARSARDQAWARRCIRQLRALRTDFFEARMLGLALACVQQVRRLAA